MGRQGGFEEPVKKDLLRRLNFYINCTGSELRSAQWIVQARELYSQSARDLMHKKVPSQSIWGWNNPYSRGHVIRLGIAAEIC